MKSADNLFDKHRLLVVASASSAFAAEKDIVDTAVAAGSFNTLVTAVTKANLVETLKGPSHARAAA
jgi:uncharacterized surface protein with fasciclin (FAS1) repeats